MATSNAYLFSKDFALWGKMHPFLSLPGHMLSTGIISQHLLLHGSFHCALPVLSEALGLTEAETIAFSGFFSSVHDIGKCHPSFLSKRAEEQEYFSSRGLVSAIDVKGTYFSHAQYTRILMQGFWKERRWDRHLLDVLQFHHQRQNSGEIRSYQPAGKCLAGQQDALRNLCIRFFQPPAMLSVSDCSTACEILMGLVIVSDWIASSSDLVEKLQPMDSDATFLSMKTYLEQDYLPAFLRDNHMDYAPFRDVYPSFSSFFPHLTEPRPIQSGLDTLFASHSPESLRSICIEAPMGEGKTEASLYAAYRLAQAWGKDGIFFALPTMATSNQMWERLQELKKEHGRGENTQLIHSMSRFLSGPEDPQEEHSLFMTDMRRQLLSHIGVGTIDQILMAVLMGSCYGAVRFAGLLSKVLVFDELHSYDAYMQELIRVLLHWCRVLRIPVVMLSATLRKEQKDQFFQSLGCSQPSSQSAYPLFTTVSTDGSRIEQPIPHAQPTRDIPICFAEKKDIHSVVEVFHEAFSKTGGKGCFCLLQNSVKEAQDLYLALKEDPLVPPESLRLLHSRLLLRDRQMIEQEVTHLLSKDSLHRPSCFILVSTQIVEQSLDLDFDVLISDLAPMDLIFQRLGRLWRHKRSWRPSCEPLFYILTKDTYPEQGIYFSVYLQETEKILRELSSVRIPEQIPELVERVYLVQPIEDLSKQENAKTFSIGEPDEASFYLSTPGVSWVDEEISFFQLPAPTRDATSSHHACFLPKPLWDKVHGIRVEDMHLAREAIGYSTNIPSYIDTKAISQPGKGLLHGFQLYQAEDGDCLSFRPSVEISYPIGLYVL